MKTKYINLILLFLLGFSVSAPAQSESGFISGLQNSLKQFAEATAETNQSLKQMYDGELVRRAWIIGSDIRMRMNADFKEDVTDIGQYGVIGSIYTSERSGEVYAEFDWQNLAEKLIAKKSAYETEYNIMVLGSDSQEHEAEEHTMYVDALGFWYVPTEIQGNEVYVRVNMMDKMQGALNTLDFSLDMAIEAKITEVIDQLALKIDWAALNMSDFGMGLGILSEALSDPNVDVTAALISELKKDLKDEMMAQLKSISNAPPLIHFAFLFSPALGRSMGLQEETITSEGQVLVTKMTVTSGKQKGYIILFDQYGRLIHLRDTDGSTADYMYDKDVTVNIPPAMDMGNLMKQMSPVGISDK